MSPRYSLMVNGLTTRKAGALAGLGSARAETARDSNAWGGKSQKNLSLTIWLAIRRSLSNVYGCLFERRAAKHGD